MKHRHIDDAFGNDFTFDVTFTTDGGVPVGERRMAKPSEVERYLNVDPRHAVILHAGNSKFYGLTPFEPEIFVFRGAGEDLGNFYWAHMPAEDPGDSVGGDLTAYQALVDSTTEYWQ